MELTPKQAEKLSSYRNDGQIQLTLRNPLDNFIAAAPKKKVYRKRVAKPVEEAPPEVIIIKGTTWEKKKLPI
jgi:Flp pilus assembly protein CpaB